MKEQCLRNIEELLSLVLEENKHQIDKWGVQNHNPVSWLAFTTEELGEVSKAISEWKYRKASASDVVTEAIQTATLSLKIAEMFMEEAKVKKLLASLVLAMAMLVVGVLPVHAQADR